MTNWEELHDAFKEATAAFFETAVGLNHENLPFTVRVDDANGLNLLTARIVKTPEGVVYLDEDAMKTMDN